MTPLAIAISGPIGSGKTTVAKALAERVGAQRIGFGDYVRKVARTAGLDSTNRTVLQDLGDVLVRWPEEMCGEVLRQFPASENAPLIIDGVRHVTVLEALRRLVRPRELKLVYLDADRATLLTRWASEGDQSKVDDPYAHDVEHEVETLLRTLADIVVDNGSDATLSLVIDKIEGFILAA